MNAVWNLHPNIEKSYFAPFTIIRELQGDKL